MWCTSIVARVRYTSPPRLNFQKRGLIRTINYPMGQLGDTLSAEARQSLPFLRLVSFEVLNTPTQQLTINRSTNNVLPEEQNIPCPAVGKPPSMFETRNNEITVYDFGLIG